MGEVPKTGESCHDFRHGTPMQGFCKKNIIQISKSVEADEPSRISKRPFRIKRHFASARYCVLENSEPASTLSQPA
jgi:hypothetical protein